MGETRRPVGASAAEDASNLPSDRAAGSAATALSENARSGNESRVVVRELLERGRRSRDRRRDPFEVSPLPTAASSRASAPISEVAASGSHRPAGLPELSEGPPSPETFLELFHEYERYVASIGTRILGRNNGVDDLVQEVFLVIYQEFHKLRGLSSIKAWLATIATRLAWRQRGRPWLFSKLSLAQVEELSPLESTDASPELQADLSVLLERLRAMPVSLRDPWLLRFIDGETLPRIAELCDCSQSTVQRRLREAGEIMLGTRRPESVSID